MKHIIKISEIILVIISIFLFHSCEEKPTPPIISTTDVTAISYTNAASGGEVTNEGGASVTAKGVCWNTSLDPTVSNSKTTDGTGTGSFNSSLTGLTAGTTYYIRAYATNSAGTGYGNQVSFSTLQVAAPVLTTAAITSITSTTAVSGGNITTDNGSSVTTRGVCWNTITNPTIANNKTTDGTGTGAFTSSITALTANTTYYVRAYATNSVGTGYGSVISFISSNSGIIFNPNLTYGSLTDIDGNVYKTIIIGTPTWMAENLKTTKYNDGTPIPLVTDGAAWAVLYTPGYCWYNNDAATYKATYGALYNWFTVNTGKLCPTGWHVPTDVEWTILITYLGGNSVAGGKLKETGTSHWSSPNTGATNSSGFTALPGGWLGFNGTFFDVGHEGGWWSSYVHSTSFAWRRHMNDISSGVSNGNFDQRDGFSVRCVKDN